MHFYDVGLVKGITAAWADRLSNHTEPLSEQAKRVKEVIDAADLGEEGGAVKNLLNIALGEKVFSKEPFNIPRGAMIVPLKNFVTHNYPLGEPAFMIWGNNNGLRIDRTEGNCFNQSWATEEGRLRPATEKEIDTFFATAFPE